MSTHKYGDPTTLDPMLQVVYVFAARYTHHRDTGGTLAVVSALRLVWAKLSDSTKDQILRESAEATTNRDDWACLKSFHANASSESPAKTYER